MNQSMLILLITLYSQLLICEISIEKIIEHATHHYYHNEYAQSLYYFEQAVAIDAENEILLFNAGLLNYLNHNCDRALHFFEAALARNSNYEKALSYRLTALVELSTMAMAEHKLDDAMMYFKKILEQCPDNIDVLYNIAYALRLQGNDQESITYYEKVIALKFDYKQAHFGYSKSLLAVGNFEQGLQEFEWRWPDSQQCIQELGHHNLTESMLAGKKILVRAEWGLGDTMQFIRYAKLLKEYGAYVIVQVDEPLVRLFSLCPYIDELVAVGQEFPPFDYQVPILSLPRLFSTTLKTIPAKIPYLYADQALSNSWQSTLSKDTRYKIGICWQAKPDIFLEDFPTTKRSVPLSFFYDLARIPGVSVYSLQQQHGLEPLENLPNDVMIQTFSKNFDRSNGRYMDTAAVIEHLDLVISVDTSVIHLAGALGKKVWVALPYVAEWRWMHDRTDTPWYPSMTLFRQPIPGDWNSVFVEIIKNIKQHLLLKDSSYENNITT